MTGAQAVTDIFARTLAVAQEQADRVSLKLLDYSYLQTDNRLIGLPPGKPIRSTCVFVSGAGPFQNPYW